MYKIIDDEEFDEISVRELYRFHSAADMRLVYVVLDTDVTKFIYSVGKIKYYKNMYNYI